MKVSLMVLLGLLATAILRKQSAAVRHFVLAATLASAAATPALRVVAPMMAREPGRVVVLLARRVDRPATGRAGLDPPVSSSPAAVRTPRSSATRAA